MDDISDVFGWMSQVHNIQLDEKWLTECLNFLKRQELPLQSKQAIRDAVFEQWLLADVKEAMKPCFPLNIANLPSLKGSFAVQINVIWDITEPFYSQLMKLDPHLNDNIDVCEDRAEEEQMKPNLNKGKVFSRRQHMMELTDGVQTVMAMEYMQIPSLNVNISPGAKVLIKGEMQCSLGMLLLTAANVQLLGGEEENLVVENTPHNVLNRLIRTRGNWSETTDASVGCEINRSWRPDADLVPSLPVRPQVTRMVPVPSLPVRPQVTQRTATTWETVPVPEERDYFADDDDDLFGENVLNDADEQLVDGHVGNEGLEEFEFYEPDGFEDEENYAAVDSLMNIASLKGPGPYFLTVRAKVTSLVSNLEHSCRSGWKLIVNIDDGSATVQAIMSDPVLAEILELTSQEARVLKSSRDKAASSLRFEQCIARGTERLRNLHQTMDVKVENGSVQITALC